MVAEISKNQGSITIQFRPTKNLIRTTDSNSTADFVDMTHIYNSSFFYLFGMEMMEDGKSVKTTGEVHRLDQYLEATAKKNKAITMFSNTGVDYILLNNIVNDLLTCLNYFKSKGFRLIEKKKEMIYVIDGRFLFLTETLVDGTFHQESEENILKLICELCGKVYTAGEPVFAEIKGTMLHKILSQLV